MNVSEPPLSKEITGHKGQARPHMISPKRSQSLNKGERNIESCIIA